MFGPNKKRSASHQKVFLKEKALTGMTDLRYRTNMIVNYLGGMSKWELNVSQKKLIWAIFPTRLFTGAKDTQRISLEQTLEIAVVVSRSLLFAVQ